MRKRKRDETPAAVQPKAADPRGRVPSEAIDPSFAYGVAFMARVNHQTARRWLAGQPVGRGRARTQGLHEQLVRATEWALAKREEEKRAA